MERQITSTIMMIKPVAFRFNEQTATNNHYQKVLDGLESSQAQAKALEEFNAFVDKLRAAGLEVIVFEDTLEPDTPDSIFPNNWISFHEDGTVALYPMYAPNRRQERRQDIIDILQEQHNFKVNRIVNLSHFEDVSIYLEGTGSLVLDRQNKIAYACLSPRTNSEVLDEFCNSLGYKAIAFNASQTFNGQLSPIYHTNVMMCIAEELAIVCSESIKDEIERATMLDSLRNSGKEIIDISEEQKNFFAGNMLQTVSQAGEKLMIMSEQAYNTLNENQINTIEKTNKIIYSSLDIIEACGGGSARCMMAEIFLPR